MKTICFIGLLMLMLVPHSFAQEHGADEPPNCDPAALADKYSTLIADSNEEIDELWFYAEELLYDIHTCETGLFFYGTGDTVETTFIPDGIYRFILTGDGAPTVNLVVVNGYCTFNGELTLTYETGEAADGSEGLLMSEDCSAIIFVTDIGEWSLEFQELTGDDDIEPILETDQAEMAIEAVFVGDFATASQYFCEEELETIEGATAPENITVTAECEAESSQKMVCMLNITLLEEGEPASQHERPLVLAVVDGKLCGEAE